MELEGAIVGLLVVAFTGCVDMGRVTTHPVGQGTVTWPVEVISIVPREELICLSPVLQIWKAANAYCC